MNNNVPKSSGGALVQCIVSILCGFVILGIAFYGWIKPWNEHKDWVEVEVSLQYSDCGTGTCYGSRGHRYSCPKCTLDYEYVYKGKTYKGKKYYESPSDEKTKKALINPKTLDTDTKPYDPPSMVLFWVEIFLALFAFGFAFMFGSLYRSFRTLEKCGRKDLIEKISNGEDVTSFTENEIDTSQNGYANRKLEPPKPKYKRN